MEAKKSDPSLTEGSIVGHMIRLSIPASTGMIFNTLYNLTDIWFAGYLSDNALAGLSIASSVFFLLLSIGIGIQTGASAMIAPGAGRGETHEVKGWLDNVSGLAIAFSALSCVIGFFAARPLVVLLGAEPNIEPLAMDYLWVTLAGSLGFTLSFGAAGALMALGDTKSNRNALMVGFVANFGLNPLFTFVLDLGVSGIALATVVIKFATAFYLFRVLMKRLNISVKPTFDKARWRDLLRQILPASFNMLTIILGGFITVALIGQFGSEHVAGYTVGLRLEQVLLLPALGLNSAVMAIAGQNMGLNYFDRVSETYRKGLLIGLFMAFVSIPVMYFLSPLAMSLFTDDTTIQSTGITYLRIDTLAFYAYVILFQSVAVLQAMQKPMFPMYLGIARQLVVPAAINYTLIIVLDYPMVSMFYTIVGVVILSAVIAFFYTTREISRLSSA
ncbi:MATE family efflux transporter [Alteromonas sp. RW2A1]|jgi:putative MATE family efflux protein|uniref:MATE family efflux transporter n=1 Tax=Alteromonas sp. RW2A1 TaxID=1917158 RepID=UPI0009035FCB|nr:MATE family efflux transporter [Alteromonas sp. RW2A1]APE05385.1 MATE family efflux transporter [Alteromonas sp. RW2A1]